MFTTKEVAYIKSQMLARISTVADNLQPDVAPVGFDFDGAYFYIGGRHNETTRKYKNVASGHTQVALVIDDLESVKPWVVHGVKIYGTADIVKHEGYAGNGAYLRIKPTASWRSPGPRVATSRR